MSENEDFVDWIKRVRAGDPVAAEKMVRDYEPYIRRAARSRLRSSQLRRVLDSVDVCQSVLASLFKRTAKGQYELETPEQLQKLLTRMVQNKVTDAWRKLTVRILGSGDVDLGQIPSNELAVDDSVCALEVVALVRDHLPTEALELFDLRAAGVEWNDIARRYGATAEALRKRLTRALATAAAQAGVYDEP